MQIPRKAESFSSLSLMFLRDVHLVGGEVAEGNQPLGLGHENIYGGTLGSGGGSVGGGAEQGSRRSGLVGAGSEVSMARQEPRSWVGTGEGWGGAPTRGGTHQGG